MRLADVARRYVAQRLAGVDVAFTGSAARGNARPDSDVDLWVIGSTSGRSERRFQGVSVTELSTPLDEALSFDTLCLFEVNDLLVLHDRGGSFDRIRRAFSRQRARRDRAIERATLESLRFELNDSVDGTAWHRIVRLRQVAIRLAAWWVFRRTGWRVPRLSVSLEHVPRTARTLLESVVGATRLRATTLHRLALALGRMLPRRAWADPRPQVSFQLTKRLHHAPVDAVILARSELLDVWLPPIQRAYGLTDIGACAPWPVGAAIGEVLGLEGVGLFDDRAVARLAADVEALRRALQLPWPR